MKKEVAVKEIIELAKEDLKRRKFMAELGLIPPLVAMVVGGSDQAVLRRQRLAVQALTELANGSFTNKALMVEAGILSKLPKKNRQLRWKHKARICGIDLVYIIISQHTIQYGFLKNYSICSQHS